MVCAKCGHDLGDMDARVAFISAMVAEDEYIHSYWRCDACGFYTLEIFRDRFMGSEDVTVDGPISPEEGDAIADFIKRCPDPGNKRCACDVHRWAGGESGGASPTDTQQANESDRDSAAAQREATDAAGPRLLKCPCCARPTDS